MIRLIFWPFIALWHLLTFILSITGRLIAAVFGLVLIMVGIVLTVTVVGAPIGIPIIVLGFLFVVRALF